MPVETTIVAVAEEKALEKGAELLLGYILKRVNEHIDKRRAAWWWEISKNYRDGACSAEEFEREIRERLDGDLEPREQTVKLLTISHRVLTEAVDDRILPTLGRLTAQYLEGIYKDMPVLSKAIDPFFRGMCRVLLDLSYEELQELRHLAERTSTEINSACPGYSGKVRLQENPHTRACTAAREASADKLAVGSVASLRRLAHLLVTHGLAEDVQVYDGWTTLIVPIETLQRLTSIVVASATDANPSQ